jgi:hypothetical protein
MSNKLDNSLILDNQVSVNCQACGIEYLDGELKTIKLSGFGESISVCESCLLKTAEDSFKDAAKLLDEIIKIAHTVSDNPERRLRAIKSLIGERK